MKRSRIVVVIGLGYVLLTGVIVGLVAGIIAAASGVAVLDAVLVGSSGTAATITIGLGVVALLT